jgi:hypothetical protein
MVQTRREFFASSCAVAVSLLGPLGAYAMGERRGLPILKGRRGHVMVKDLTFELFQPHVDTVFSVGGTEVGRHRMKLVEVASRESNPAIESFSLLFEGPVQPLLPQGIYRFDHPGIGDFEIFIVPVGQTAGGTRYEAVFNRLKQRN